MPVSLDIRATERSTYVVEASFTDEDGAQVVPSSDVSWTLTDRSGSVNFGSGTVTAAPTVNIVLSGDTLRFQESSMSAIRTLTVETTYDSTVGVGLPIKAAAEFVLENLGAVS